MTSSGIRIGRIHLHVRDLDRATRFYANVLGLEVAHSAPGLVCLAGGASHHDLVLHGGAQDVRVPPLAPGCGSIGFDAGDRATLAAVCERLTRSGARVAAIERGLTWSVHTTDPDGNRVEVFCDTGGQASGRARWAVTGRALSLDELRQAREDDRLAMPVA